MPLITKSSYKSPFFLFNKHIQTIYPALFRKVANVDYQRERIETADCDFLDLDWLKNNLSDKLVVISHGLEGDSQRPYVKGLAKALHEAGYEILAWNFRGCSGEVNKQLRFYHSGATEDLDFVINYALQKKSYKEVILAGFSLGGNLTLKYLGENCGNLSPALKKAVVFSVPLHLHSSCLEISKPENYIYSKRFLKRLKKKIKEKSLLIPDKLSISGYHKIKNLKDFDDNYTAPLHGFKDAVDYYDACSAIGFLEKISIPTLIINAKNDPFLSIECFPEKELKSHNFVYFEAPETGGHCGFYANNPKGLYWSEIRTLEFINSKH